VIAITAITSRLFRRSSRRVAGRVFMGVLQWV